MVLVGVGAPCSCDDAVNVNWRLQCGALVVCGEEVLWSQGDDCV